MSEFGRALERVSSKDADAQEPYQEPYGCDVIRLLIRLLCVLMRPRRIRPYHEPYDVTSIRLMIRLLCIPEASVCDVIRLVLVVLCILVRVFMFVPRVRVLMSRMAVTSSGSCSVSFASLCVFSVSVRA